MHDIIRRCCPSKYSDAQSRLIDVSIGNRNVICNRSSYFHRRHFRVGMHFAPTSKTIIHSFLPQRWTFHFRMHRYLVRYCKQFTASTPTCTQAINVDKLNFNLSLKLLPDPTFPHQLMTIAGRKNCLCRFLQLF